jgi:hypothetical protein
VNLYVCSEEGYEVAEVELSTKNAVFWDMTPCGSCKNRRSGGTYRLHHQGEKTQLTGKKVNSI